ncbi:hypothetical protein GCM10011494_01360 [Novosphingobium endophyticum]|uniref:Uncharacterized protein n=1 Tax=Novosphingobium endophyticum TaxID=1955250 RepID=A0A916TNJ0_9SPHN|nr:hypothetical protein GCM10011494_01360 [Novosphingobium endophyticum]
MIERAFEQLVVPRLGLRLCGATGTDAVFWGAPIRCPIERDFACIDGGGGINETHELLLSESRLSGKDENNPEGECRWEPQPRN